MNVLDMKETGAKVTREYQTLEPVFIRKLVNKAAKVSDAADLIGVTATTINSYLKHNEATKAMELAAQLIYERDFAESERKTKPVAAIVQGELHHIKTVKDMVEMLGGKFTYLEL